MISSPPRPASESSGERPTVAVVGAGFSGLLTALHLLAAPHGPRVRLIEQRPWFGRGAAYSTTSAEHLLNVRAANMSAFPDRPRHFLDWLAQAEPEAPAAAFVTRAQYGRYLQAMLRQAAETAEPGRLILEADGAAGLQPRPGERWSVVMEMGRAIAADAVVLAVGNLPPHLPPGVDAAVGAAPAYFGEPWSADFTALPEEGEALLLGAGLTMVDVALRLARERPGLRMLAVSRRGLLPRRHLDQGPSASPWEPHAGEAGPLALLREVRRRAAKEDWRAVIDGLRPHVQSVWRDWSLAERQRFLRHLRAWWDVHRHRIAPAVAAKIDHLTAVGRLRICAGRFAAIRPEGEGLHVAWRPRGAAHAVSFHAAAAVNCTGPNGDLTRSRDPLVADLAARGLVRPDACRLGLDVDRHARLVAADGRAQPSLYAVGPTTRGAFWEITSVPDIRVQAASAAETILRSLAADPVRA